MMCNVESASPAELFQELQTAFDRAAPAEQNRLAAQFYAWAEQRGLVPGKPALDGLDSSQLDLQTLVEREIHLRQMAENIEQVFWVRDLHTDRILYVSPAYETVWGRSRASLYAEPRSLIESVHPEDRLQLMVTKAYDDRKLLNQEYRILRPDGTLRWILARTFLIHEVVGPSFRLVSFAQDITDQKKIELALRQALDRTREQFTLSRKMSLARKPEAVLKALMSAHELRSAQRAAVLFFEYPQAGPARGLELRASWQGSQIIERHTLAGQKIPPWPSEATLYEEPGLWELLQPNRPVMITVVQSDVRLTPVVRDLLLEGQIHTLAVFPLVALADWLGCLLVFYTQAHAFEPIELRHLKVLVDQATITLYNLQLLEVEEQSRHEAERANEIKTQFLAMISHELRTPLTSIQGFATTLLADDVTWEPAEQRDFIQTIQRETERLEGLIDHLLDLTRLEAGMLPIVQEAHSLEAIVKDALPQFQTLIRGQALNIQLPPNLPPVLVDAKRIAQVLVNLVRNACMYAPGTEIHLSASIRGNFVQVNVADQGPGISPDERKKVFEAFRRGVNVENGLVQGAGLGLAICKGLVEAHGGRIWIKKKTTPGATIAFTVPVLPRKAAVAPVDEENLAQKDR
jgi:PAS domain S-box-containing protein